jgi:putative nucleotidyltransferase with HDIG domain
MSRWGKIGVILLLLGLVSALHFSTATTDPALHAWHLFFRKLYFLPIVVAAVWFGLGGALLAATLAVAVYALHVQLNWPQAPMEQMNQFGEMLSFGLLAAVAGALASLERRNRELAQREKIRTVVAALTETLAARDPATRDHCRRVARLAEKFAAQLGLSREDRSDIFLAGMLHDIGKIGIRDDILLKPASLTPEERRKIMDHPRMAEQILAPVGFPQVIRYVATHHENVDGSGYPLGLSGESIPLGGRILAIADTYDALTSKRPYHQPLADHDKVSAILNGMSGSKLDHALVEKFLTWRGPGRR